jgi:transposase
MRLSAQRSEPVSQLGIDDWSLRRGRQFGTILVNVATHEIIDLLPDRETQTAQAWMQAHPEIDIVSRDRSEEYATAARKGAPQARQVADRYHLTDNLRDARRREPGSLSHGDWPSIDATHFSDERARDGR